jgi:uncharacterized protein
MTGLAPMAFPMGVIIASLVSAVGIGGGILWMPFFIIFLKLPPDAAVITSLVVQTAGMGSGTVACVKRKSADLTLAGFLLVLTLPGIAVGALMTRLLTSGNLELALGIFTLTSAFVFVSVNQRYADMGKNRVSLKQARQYGWVVSLMAVASGMLSVSIGEWLVPLMRSRLQLRMHTAVGTSIVTIFGTCIAGAVLHGMLGASVVPIVLLWAIPGVIIGGQVGPRLAEKINERMLKEVFIFLLTLIGIHLIYNSV